MGSHDAGDMGAVTVVIGVGRVDPEPALEAFGAFLARRAVTATAAR